MSRALSADAVEILKYLRWREELARVQPRDPGHELCSLERELRLIRGALCRKGFVLNQKAVRS